VSDDPARAETVALPRWGRYQLLAKLGEGGMGQVYLANDTRLDRRVALKVLPPDSINDPDAVARFRREAKALAQLAHPGIVQAFDCEEDAGRHFLVMEYVEGQSLAAVLKGKGRLAPARAADYAYQAAQALQHAHERGLVHRDIKPSNLLLTTDGRVKLLDLGLARFLQDQVADPSRTREGVGMGTPDYAAPEQFRDARTADARADVYSLGCTLYQLLTGQVPFPGSSLSEKYDAHATREPAPVEDLCPEVPGGLALAVRRMMAKRPGDRFQSAAEVAEALSPFVAGSSPSFEAIRRTSSWRGSRLTVRDLRPRRRLLPWGVAGLCVVALLLVLVLAFGPRRLGGGSAAEEKERLAGQMEPDGAGRAGGQPGRKPSGKGGGADQHPGDPDVLTVSKKGEGGGKYRTIGAALKDVRPGQTVRVLDGEVYQESLALNVPRRHEGVTLEAVRGATLETTTPTDLIAINGVRDVTVRGFRLRATDVALGERGAIFVAVQGACPGLLLERLEAETNRKGSYNAVTVEQTKDLDTDKPPAVVRGCVFHEPHIGVRVAGADEAVNLLPAGRVVVRDNLIFNPAVAGVELHGGVRDVHVVGNRIGGGGTAGLLLSRLLAGTRGVLIANNTVFGVDVCCAFHEGITGEQVVQLRNNLFLAPQGADVIFFGGTGQPGKPRFAKDGKSLHKLVRFGRNWREGQRPEGGGLFARGWVPPAEDDTLRERIPGVNRDPKDPLHFLRPAKDSPVATRGAGRTDPWLPSYVGALPPEGVEPWDWDRTWRARAPGRPALLTVSKDPKDKARFRTINDALKSEDLKPWATVRVLDAATYPEAVVLDDPARHEGVALEAVRGATIMMTTASPALTVKGVPHVRVRGFALREARARSGSTFVVVRGHTPGVVLEALDLRGGLVFGVIVQNVENAPDEDPLVVRRCSVRVGIDGITVGGVPRLGREGIACQGVVVRENRVSDSGYRGILLQGAVARALVAGNVVWKCGQAGAQFQDLAKESERILVANNTAFASDCPFRIWCSRADKSFGQRRVEVRNNLFFEALGADVGLLLAGEKGHGLAAPEMARAAVEGWRLDHNYRDLSGRPEIQLPLSTGDRELKDVVLLSREPGHKDFLRPAGDSPLAKGGAGPGGPWLPSYVGAVPPRGIPSWDWALTWRARMREAVTPGKGAKRAPSSD
jgi:hypothetical protein